MGELTILAATAGYGLLMGCAVWAVCRRWDDARQTAIRQAGAFCAGCLIDAAAHHQWGRVAVDTGVLAGLVLWRWWRKNRGRVKALLGAKAKAIRDALVRKQRERTRARPGLRPAPGGAG